MIRLILLLACIPLCSTAQKRDRELIDSLAVALRQSADDTNRIKLLYNISHTFSTFNQDSGIHYGVLALQKAEIKNWQKGIGRANTVLAENYLSRSEYGEALERLGKALKAYEAMRDTTSIISTLNKIGTIYDGQAYYQKALDHYFRALRLNEQARDSNGVAAVLANIGLLYSMRGEYGKAIDNFSRSLKIAENLNNIPVIAGNNANMAIIYTRLKNYEKALASLSKSLQLMEQLGNKQAIGAILGNIGGVYYNQEKYTEALAQFRRSLSVYESINNKSGIAFALGNIGNCYVNIGGTDRYREGKNYLEKAIAICKQTGDLNHLQYFFAGLAKVDSALGDHKNALAAFKQHIIYKDSIFSKDNNNKITQLENRRELDLREARIAALQQKATIGELNYQKERVRRNILIAGVVIILISVLLLYRNIRRKQKTEKQVAGARIASLLKEQELRSVNDMLEGQEKERKRIAADLHDRLGSMLSTVKLYFGSVEEQMATMQQADKAQYATAVNLLDEACDEVRKISHGLVSGELVKFGLIAALRQLANTVEGTGQIKVKVLVFSMENRLENSTEITLYRVIQELLNNILKHAKATAVTIQLNKAGNELNIVVEDNGTGFDYNAALRRGGMGIRNISSRIAKLNGSIAFDSTIGKGTTTIIDIPL